MMSLPEDDQKLTDVVIISTSFRTVNEIESKFSTIQKIT